jgi:hypothetical protein
MNRRIFHRKRYLFLFQNAKKLSKMNKNPRYKFVSEWHLR